MALALAVCTSAVSQRAWTPAGQAAILKNNAGREYVQIYEGEAFLQSKLNADGTPNTDGYVARLRFNGKPDPDGDYSKAAESHIFELQLGRDYLARSGVDKCVVAQTLYHQLFATIGLDPGSPVDCGKFSDVSRGPSIFAPDSKPLRRLAAAPAICAGPESLAGTWTDPRPASQAAEPGGVRLTVAQKDGQWRGDRPAGSGKYVYAPRSVTGLAVSKVPSKEAGVCAYDATCLTDGGSPQACRIKLDAKADTIRFSIADVDAYGGTAWTRSAAPTGGALACQASDIEGAWNRTDGARVVVNGAATGFKDGANALIYGHPDGWPPGVFKFSNIKPGAACKWTAQCVTVFRDPAGRNGFRVATEACTLTVDPKARTLTASGSHGAYRR